MSLVEQALVEVRLRMVAMGPAHEGLRDYVSMNLTASAKAIVRQHLDMYDAMLKALTAAEAALMALLETSYPELPPVSVPKPELDDLQNQLDTITAARAQFVPLAVGGEITFGPEEQ